MLFGTDFIQAFCSEVFLTYLTSELFAFQVLSYFPNFFTYLNIPFFSIQFSLVCTGYVLDAESIFIIILHQSSSSSAQPPLVPPCPAGEILSRCLKAPRVLSNKISWCSNIWSQFWISRCIPMRFKKIICAFCALEITLFCDLCGLCCSIPWAEKEEILMF